MWTETPRPLFDGVLVALAAGLLGATIVTLLDAKPPAKVPRKVDCQEAVYEIKDTGDTLARCPVDSYLELGEGYVICRCGTRREPLPPGSSELL